MELLVNAPPCVLYEDEHLLVVNKPAGLNTHSPAPYAGEGIYDWLRNRERRWAHLAIIHRLDKETSGVLVFSKSDLANRSLTAQFASRAVKKTYVLLTDRPRHRKELTIRNSLIRAGDKYVGRELHAGADTAETVFRTIEDPVLLKAGRGVPRSPLRGQAKAWVAQPLTGRTHQIRAHAAEAGFPILGDTLYGGTPAQRVCLHAAEISFAHPQTGEPVTFSAPVDFSADPREQLRAAILNTIETNAFRVINGASDGYAGWYLERLGENLLSQSAEPLQPERVRDLEERIQRWGLRGAAHKVLTRQVRRADARDASPKWVCGTPPTGPFTVMENGLQYELSFDEGYSVGLFLDQRDNRRRLLTRHAGRDFELTALGNRPAMLNTFSYTCAFSVCGAKAGFHTTSLDLSRKYLDWGRRNFKMNALNPAEHDFVYGDTFDWLKRWAKKGRRFEVVILDPPTFSQSRVSGVFRAEKDYGRLVAAALSVLAPEGVLLASCSAERWAAEEFVRDVDQAIRQTGRALKRSQYYPQPPDFPISKEEPAYFKSLWVQVG